jgi:S-adenosyl methyltransferase
VHDVAQQIAPEVWAAHLESDPVVHVRACTLLTGDGNRGIVLADLRETEALLAHPGVRDLIDSVRQSLSRTSLSCIS